MPTPTEMSKEHYPVLHYDGDKELGLPCCGEMTVVFKVISETSRERNGKHSYSCEIEIRSIKKVKGAAKPPASSGSEAGSALDKLKAEYEENGNSHEGEEY